MPYHTGGAVMTLYDLALSKRINNNPAVVIQAVIPLLGRGRQENKEFEDSLKALNTKQVGEAHLSYAGASVF